MSQHALRSENHQRLAPRTASLTAQHVEILRGVRRLTDLNVFFTGQLQKTFDARAGMFRALAFESVRQEHDNAGWKIPFVLAGADELVDDHLRAVHEISELRLPQNQRFGVVAAEAVLKTKAT